MSQKQVKKIRQALRQQGLEPSKLMLRQLKKWTDKFPHNFKSLAFQKLSDDIHEAKSILVRQEEVRLLEEAQKDGVISADEAVIVANDIGLPHNNS